MKKIILPLFCCILLSVITHAQAYEGKTEYDKKKQAAFVIEFPYPPEAVENAIIEKMRKMGHKGKEEKGLFNKDKGFRVYKNAHITEISSSKMDYVIQVDRKSRKEKDESILYLIILKGDENAITTFDAADMSKAKGFLNNLLPDVEDANLELQIKAQEDVIVKAEKKMKNLQTDQKDMEDKIKKLQDDIEENGKNQETTQKDIETQKELLESLKKKRRG